MYENRVDTLKAKDLAILEDFLTIKEEEEAKLKAEEAGAASGTQAKGKPDPKKDAKKAPAKGAVVAEDKNSPQSITVEYPEDKVEQLANYIIYEK
jgi:hypothetical protein